MHNTPIDIEPYRISRHNEPYLYSVNRDSFEKQNSQTIFERTFQDKLWQKDTFYIVLGTDGGVLVDYVLEHGLPYGACFIFIDLPHVLASIEAQLTFTKWDERVSLCTLEEWQRAAEDYKIQSYLYTEKVTYIKSVAARDAYQTLYYEMDTELSLTLESLKHKTMVSLSRRPFITRQLENLSENATPLVQLEGVFKEKTCVVLGGGPSLDNDIEWVKENRAHLVILAVSRIAKKLIQHNLIPHMIFSVDPHDVSFDVSKELLELPNSVVFVHSNYVVPSLLGQWAGKHYYCGGRVPWESKLNQPNQEIQGPTVTNSAISAAVAMGFKRILLTGVDLCYAKNGVTHASGSNEAKIGPQLGFKGQWVETYEGKQAETSTEFLHASLVLSEQANKAKENGCEFINLSETAAKMPHITHLTSNKIALDHAFDAQKMLEQCVYQNPNLVQDNKTILNELQRLIKEINEVNRIAEGALADNIALYKKYNNENKNYQFKLKLDKAEKKLTTKLEATSNFIKRFGIKNFIKTVRTDADQEWSDEEMKEVGRLYYQAFIDTIEDLKPLLIDAKERLENRIEEYKPSPKIKKLMQQWQRDKHFKRAVDWLNNQNAIASTLSDTLKAQFAHCQQEYLRILKNTDTPHYRRTIAQSSITGLNRKIFHLFQRRNIEALEQLAINLKQKLEAEISAEWLLSLTNAYIAILNTESSIALDHFAKIDETELTEDEAIQISALAIDVQDFKKATYFMEKLSNLSDVHKPRYASILRLNGELEKSRQMYQEYLDKNENDADAWFSLGKVALELEDVTHASQAFAQVLTIAPEHKEAQLFMKQI